MTHKEKMELKRNRRKYEGEWYGTQERILANISRNHEHYGDTPLEHAERKASEKSS